MKTACVILIGNEILSGRTQDTNLTYLGQGLNEVGVRLISARVIPDVTEVIADTVNECRATHDYLFTTGGIGPTHDDITADAIAKAFGVELVRDPGAVAALRTHYTSDDDLNEQRLKMCDIPQGAELIHNPISKAPGFCIENVYVLAGVPVIMQAMFDGLKDNLVGGEPMLSRSIACYIGESLLAARLGEIQAAHSSVEIGSYPFIRDGKLGASLVMRSTDAATNDAAADAIREMILSLGAEPIEE
ncbi:MAG: competence/damage-inducible protein A [Rhodospirillaceae bacterium]|jgi:molybdenum cofactor synthesis domain-containing protein|nr:competence/damage-inducible protein A [Rhodospirillaceae bacterium]MBT5014280.1 competence/damage-inducible protein A [Rhodospirillaceae bacterium]